MIEKLYTVEEVAELASVTGRTIRNYLKSGRLVGRKIGGQWRFPENEVQRLLNGGEPEAEDAQEAPALATGEPLPAAPLAEPDTPAAEMDVDEGFDADDDMPPPENTDEPALNTRYVPPAPLPEPQAPPAEAQSFAAPAQHVQQEPVAAPPAASAPYAPPPAPVQAAPAYTEPAQQQAPYNTVYQAAPPAAPQPQPVYTPPGYPQAAPAAPPYVAQPAPYSGVQTHQFPAIVPGQAPQPAPAAYAPPPQEPAYQVPPTNYVYAVPAQLPLPYPPAPSSGYVQPQATAAPPIPPAEPAPAPIPADNTNVQQQPAVQSVEAATIGSETKPSAPDLALAHLSDVGRKVSKFVAEVHDCSHGPLTCTMVDLHQSLSAARATSEKLANIAAEESDAGILCQSYVEFDDRYYVARYTLFGTSTFLMRCLKLIG